jgi:hypothetical protein
MSLSLAVTAVTYSYQVIGTGGMGACMRTHPSNGAPEVGRVPEGSWVDVTGWVVGETVVDKWQGRQMAWNRWGVTPDSRYIADIYLSSGRDSYPECPAPPAETPVRSPRLKAVDWAQSQLGAITTDQTPDRMWSGWSEQFVERAYGTESRFSSARDAFNAQRAAGRVHDDANPPAGALVYYRWTSYGHVGISIGGGQVISTQGVSTPLPVRQHAIKGISLEYLGWAAAPPDWPGR